MGKIRVATLGDDQQEKEQKRRAEARRQTKGSKSRSNRDKKTKVEGVGLHGGERTVLVEGTEIKAEYKKLVEEVEQKEQGLESEQGQKSKKKRQKVKIRSKRYQEALKLVDRKKFYPLAEAIELAKQTSLTRFDGTVEVHLALNPETYQTKGEKKDFRGTVAFPHGTGKTVRVAIADEKVIAEVEAGKINFDVLVAHPSLMPKLAKLARILGPKGLMPNPKSGTVGENPEKLAQNLSRGQINFKTEPDNPLIHLAVGKVSFESKKLAENIQALLEAIGKNKIVKATLTTTMGPGIKIVI